jgi:hypothetical protein
MAEGGAVAGFVLAAYTSGDPAAERALGGLAPALRAPIEAALAEAAAESSADRRRRLIAASEALDPAALGARLARGPRPLQGDEALRVRGSTPELRGLARALRRVAGEARSAALLEEASWRA